MKKILLTILFVVTIISVPLSFSLSAIVGEVGFFGMSGLMRYIWIMWCFIPISMLLLILGIRGKQIAYIVAPCIAIFFLGIFGSYGFIFRDQFDYDAQIVLSTKEITQIYLPSKVEVGTEKTSDYTISYVKMLSKEEKEVFINSINDDSNWVGKFNSILHNSLPIMIQGYLLNFDKFMLYNLSTQEYNSFPYADGKYECILVAYDVETERIAIANFYIEVAY
ncbi:MAG: hypothetical protein J1F36_07045 [Clostridiales bacterium]|nr:hypothetical protein [Clostridiales bacterium]